jgi:hypothetical protein
MAVPDALESRVKSLPLVVKLPFKVSRCCTNTGPARVAPAVLMVRSLKVDGLLPPITWAIAPEKVAEPLVAVKVPLFVKSSFTSKVPPLKVKLAPEAIVRSLAKAVPVETTGKRLTPAGIVTSSVAVGRLFVLQLPAVDQSVEVDPVHVKVHGLTVTVAFVKALTQEPL